MGCRGCAVLLIYTQYRSSDWHCVAAAFPLLVWMNTGKTSSPTVVGLLEQILITVLWRDGQFTYHAKLVMVILIAEVHIVTCSKFHHYFTALAWFNILDRPNDGDSF
jgi:hypothetical protein